MTAIHAEVSKLAPKLSGDLKINRKKQSVNDLVANLFDTVRSSEWEVVKCDCTTPGCSESAFKFNLNKKLALYLTPVSVEVRKGLRKFPIGNGKDASRLFTNIKHAKAVIAKSIVEQDAQVRSFCKEFDIEDLDAELAGSDGAITADLSKVDIRIKPAPAFVEPAKTSNASEAAAALIADEDKEEVLSKLAAAEQAVKDIERELGTDDPEESDIFADALGNSPARNENLAKVYGSEEGTGLALGDVFSDALDPMRHLINNEAPEVEDTPKQLGPNEVRSVLGPNVKQSLKSLQGRVLGIVDAVFSDKIQREAVKTLFNKEFRREMDKY